jgi:hypothetical protein
MCRILREELYGYSCAGIGGFLQLANAVKNMPPSHTDYRNITVSIGNADATDRMDFHG